MASPKEDGEEPSYFEGRAARFIDDLSERLWRSLPVLFGLGALLLTLTGFYHVGTGQLGVVRTLGRVTGQALPGLRFRVPLVQDVELVEVTEPHRLKLGSFDTGDGDALMVTRDGALCTVSATVDFRITDPEHFTARLASPERAARALSEVALTEAISDATSQQLFGGDHREIERAVQQKLQGLFDQAESGIEVSEVRLAGVEAPTQVKEALADVATAQSERRSRTQVAQGNAERELAQAKNEALARQGTARAYATERVLRARADTAAFEIVRLEYSRAPDVTRRRLQLETLERVLQRVHDTTIVDGPVDAGLATALGQGAQAPSREASP